MHNISEIQNVKKVSTIISIIIINYKYFYHKYFVFIYADLCYQEGQQILLSKRHSSRKRALNNYFFILYCGGINW